MDENIIRLLNTYICDLKLSLRTYNVLKVNKLEKIRDLVKLKKRDLKKIKNIDNVGINEIMLIIYNNRLCFMDDYPIYDRELLNVYNEIDEPYLKRIEEFQFSLKILLSLRKKNIFNIGDLVSLNTSDLVKIKGLNKSDIALTMFTVRSLNLSFADYAREIKSR